MTQDTRFVQSTGAGKQLFIC